MEQHSVYIHVPFCQHRCYYCDFNTYAGFERWIPRYIRALEDEIESVTDQATEKIPVHTVFYGGGTPTFLPVETILEVQKKIVSLVEVQPEAEISIEANPGTVTYESLQKLRGAGFNRLSLGVQSFHQAELDQLGRTHSVEQVNEAVILARRAGFVNINLDLIFGLPGQSLESWKENMQAALKLEPEHLSLYGLTIEDHTPFGKWNGRGLLQAVDDDLAAEMYDWAEIFLGKHDFTHYEISNWARRDQAGNSFSCRHNLQYWRNLPYLGFGAGAHGYSAGYRYENVKSIPEYITRLTGKPPGEFPTSSACAAKTRIEGRVEMQETMMVGLRLLEEGVSEGAFRARFGLTIAEVFNKEIQILTGSGLLETGEQLRLTQKGHLLGNRVFREFVGD